MRTGRTVVVLWLAGGLIAACAAAQDKPGDYRGELRLIESQQRRKRYQECVAMCEKMLAHFKEAWQVKEVTWLKIENLILDSQYEAALKALADLGGAYVEDKPLQAAAGLRTGDVQRMLKRFDEAIATYRKLAAGCAKDQPDQAADALLRAGEVFCSDLKKPDQGIAIYRDLESRLGAQEPRRAAEALRRAAAAHESQTKDAAKAADDYLALTAKYASVYDESTLSGLHDKAMDCLLAAKRPTDAIAAAKKAEADLTTVPRKASFALRHGDVLMVMKRFTEARAEYGRAICSYPLERKSCQSAQAKIVETYRAEDKWAEALGAARILYDAAADEHDVRSAAQVVAQAFLAADANLLRANEFLSYQRFGPNGPDGKSNTQDDVPANHLAQVKYPPLGAALDKQFKAAVAAQPDDYDGCRAKGFLYVHWGKPKEGAACFLQAFKAASLAQVPAAAQELVLVGIKAHTASFHGLDRVFEYINYGPKGKSGKERIPDPFAALR